MLLFCREDRCAWIKDKYVNKLFLGEYNGTKEQQVENFIEACQSEDLGKMLYHIAHGARVEGFYTEGGKESLLHMTAKRNLILSSTLLIFNGAILDV